MKSVFDHDGAPGFSLPTLDVPGPGMEGIRARKSPAGLPKLTEGGVARHYAGLASMNFGVDTGFYPLGSCTMKYNPRACEDAARLDVFANAHPAFDGCASARLELMWRLQDMLAEIAGMDAVTLQPAAGAHGELTALLVFRAYHTANGSPRSKVVIPDTAHGTNPASVSLAGYETVTIASGEDGRVDLEALEAALDDEVAAVMLTNPNTLGLFERDVCRITDMVHAAGALAYCDGANLNAIVGKARPGDMGFDALHINLHKTFGTPHGGGGPGAGPVAVRERLAPFLPGPLAVRDGEAASGTVVAGHLVPRAYDVRAVLEEDAHECGEGCGCEDTAAPEYRLLTPERSIGRVRSWHGNFGVLVRAYVYLLLTGREGLPRVAEQAVLSANYLKERLKGAYDLPFDEPCMHEFVLSARRQKREGGVRALDIGKRLLDLGFHAPTVYFPLIVEEAMMVEPTESEPLETLDAFAEAMLRIADEAREDPEVVRRAPHATPVKRLDEARAVKQPDLVYRPEDATRTCE